ncbi:hypothetical protein ACFYVL_09320 [Streptomyces sp. NPDC004111]|uniref:hypothetical protein n=1 Tax=Streptomyces sp. NPDC004111 TaxID=3364690 RepID=UPI0036C7165C
MPAHHDLLAFAPALAARLPGRWHADDRTTPMAGDPARHRLWDTGPLAHTPFLASGPHRTVLTSAGGLQLYLLNHPSRKAQFIVAPLLPAGTDHRHTLGVRAPRGITVPADPVRAAAHVRRRQLFSYRLAAVEAQTNASRSPHRPVHLSLGDDGSPVVSTAYTRALHHLLAQEDFRLDPETGRCHPPAGLGSHNALQRAWQAVRELEALGFTPIVRTPHGPAASVPPPRAIRPAPRPVR